MSNIYEILLFHFILREKYKKYMQKKNLYSK